MLKSKIEQFIAKKTVICLILLTIIDIVAVNEKWLVLAGLYVGTFISIAKFSSYAWFFRRFLGIDPKKASAPQAPGSSIAVYAVNQIILLPLLFLAYFLHIRVFIGFVAGILTVPFVIMVNGITEALGITKNHFE